jgi:ParB/RepB/Spo0J family partition protein
MSHETASEKAPETGVTALQSPNEPTYAEFLPEDIIIDPEINARPYTALIGKDTPAEEQALVELAASIMSHSQLQPVRVRIGTDGLPHLIMGARRTRAIALINSSGQFSPLKVKASVVQACDDQTAQRDAIVENIQRRNLNPMDMALNIQRVRQDHGWDGKKGTKLVADHLKVSPATVTQHDRILTLEPQFQEQVFQGKLTLQGALDLLDVKPEKRAEVLAGAQETKQTEETEAEAPETPSGKGKKKAKGKGTGVRKSKAVGSKHVRKATRETEGAGTTPKALTKKEILDFFYDYYGANPETYGYPDSALQEFLGYFLDKFAKGAGSSRTLDKYFMELVKGSNMGTKGSLPKPEPDEAPKKKAAKKKASKKK